MMTTHPDPLAAAWLDRVEALAATLPPHERVELLTDLREHIDAALADGTEARSVADVLARLGDPAEVVAAASPVPARGPALAPPPSTAADGPRVPPPHGTTGAERLTLAGLVVSGLLAAVLPLSVPLWIAATIGLLTSTRWRGREVGVALGIPLGVGVLTTAPFVLFVTSARACSSVDGGPETCTGAPVWTGVVAILLLVALAVVVVGTVRWLVRQVDGRAAR